MVWVYVLVWMLIMDAVKWVFFREVDKRDRAEAESPLASERHPVATAASRKISPSRCWAQPIVFKLIWARPSAALPMSLIL